MTKYYKHLEHGDVIRSGDEVDVSNYGDDETKWEPAKMIGQQAPDPKYPAHRRYRRPLSRIVVQINGEQRCTVYVPVGADIHEVTEAAKKLVEVSRHLEVYTICNVVHVSELLINFVTKLGAKAFPNGAWVKDRAGKLYQARRHLNDPGTWEFYWIEVGTGKRKEWIDADFKAGAATVDDYLHKYAVLDHDNQMDGAWVPMSVAKTACDLVRYGRLQIK